MKAIITAFINFFCIYIPLHLLFVYSSLGKNFLITLFVSVLIGVGEGVACKRLYKYGLKHIIAFCIVFLASLGVSAWLFYGAPHQGAMQIVYCYFSQFLIVCYMIPGAICYILFSLWKARKGSKMKYCPICQKGRICK